MTLLVPFLLLLLTHESPACQETPALCLFAKGRDAYRVADSVHNKYLVLHDGNGQNATTAADVTSPDTSNRTRCQSVDTYMLGYGSLMNQASVWKTNCHMQSQTSQALKGALDNFDMSIELQECLERQPALIPVKVKGIHRGWYARGRLISEQDLNATAAEMALQMLDLAPTYLGATAGNGSCTGVIYKVDAEELAATDARELGATGAGYSAEWLEHTDIQVLGGSNGPNLNCARVRWYRMQDDDVQIPSPQFPLVQSYVDLFVGGALDLEQRHNLSGFALETILSTDGWSDHWINDRSPAYRPFDTNAAASQITHALLEAAKTPGSRLTMQHIQGIRLPGR
mmetsp:Transcript_8512/g.16081  ORF Transcript_8512/g.16081 Transcript_8512/m.16081 type:complete len:342 (-) Transcript_8512:176-1201(-)